MPPTAPATDPRADLPPGPAALRWKTLATWLLMAALWLALVGPEDPASWIVGLPAVIAATWAHGRLSRDEGYLIDFGGVARLLPLFLVGSLLGALDVARRVMGPRLAVAPGFFDYRLRLPAGAARVLFANLVSLLPGTLSADLAGDRLRVHSLDLRQDAGADLARLEGAVAAVFGAALDRPVGPR